MIAFSREVEHDYNSSLVLLTWLQQNSHVNELYVQYLRTSNL